MHRSRYANSVAVAHNELHLTRENSPIPITTAAKAGGPMQSLLLLGGLGALLFLKVVPKAQPAIKQFIHNHPILWSPVNELFSESRKGRSLGGSSQGQVQPKAPKGAREAASKAAKAAAQAAAARAAAAAVPAKVAPLPSNDKAAKVATLPPPSSSTVKVTLSPAAKAPQSSAKPAQQTSVQKKTSKKR